MALREIVHYGDPILRKVCQSVKDFSKLTKLIDDMFDTMYEESGIGLAANQVGVDLNLFIIDITDIEEEAENIYVFINSQIQESHGESWFEEGCLSIPDVRLDVKRPEFITLKYQDENGEDHVEKFSGHLARAIQHEVDHLNGVFIVDRVSQTAKMTVKKELKTIEKKAVSKSKFRKEFVL
ncbi:MAG: peptide deformylase [Candidatus Marinimicrobia bacterium]|jgi:peptide deformylase|nr:peptide deformylase [Candidatus Neomarinimicrobiota bacterium]MDP6611771.1 peptide deformylase [Candidatus Neomarinimicrobiota bacterium]|tara:strand:- start:106257 stop:106799 length:543 start_codon:yes stop_codon:yes gene_type:complete